jgi:hypothetical protein
MKYSLFQGVVKIEPSGSFDHVEILKTLSNENIKSVKLFEPGKFGKEIKYEHNNNIGSISIKLNNGISMILFSNKLVKICGSLKVFEICDNKSLKSDILERLIKPSLKTIGLIKLNEEVVYESFMFNANIRRDNAIVNYHEFVERCGKIFDITKPKIFTKSRSRGRVCAVKINSEYGGKLIVDHSGNIQAFAYRDYEYFISELTKLLNIMSII